MHSTAAVFCELRVSDVTGEVRVDRLLGSFDCGTILNPRTAASQFRGGMIMGLGLALTEETLFDERTGRIMNPTLADYHVPSHMDVPEIDVIWTGIPDPRSPLGARGIGEIGITGVAAAVANAVFNATGKRGARPPDHARQASLKRSRRSQRTKELNECRNLGSSPADSNVRDWVSSLIPDEWFA